MSKSTKAPKTYIIMRACCTSGNCVVCRGVAPFGTSVAVEHTRVVGEAAAARVVAIWGAYQAKAVEVK